MTRSPEIHIEDVGSGKRIALNTKVWLIRFDEDENEERIDISNLVKAVGFNARVGEVLTARMVVFISGIEARMPIEEVLLHEFRRPRWWRRRLRDITGFSVSGVQEYVRR